MLDKFHTILLWRRDVNKDEKYDNYKKKGNEQKKTWDKAYDYFPLHLVRDSCPLTSFVYQIFH